MATDTRNRLHDAWSLTKTYWISEDKWSSWGLLSPVVLFNLGTVCTSVGVNAWNRGY